MAHNKRVTTLSISLDIIDCFKRGNKIFILGNGGSNAMALHMAEEFLCKFEMDRPPLPAYYCFIPSSIANDYGFEHVFSRQINAHGKLGDIVIVFSTSGTSKNCLEAIAAANLMNLQVIEMPRKGRTTAQIQENQLHQMHQICRKVEQAFLSTDSS